MSRDQPGAWDDDQPTSQRGQQSRQNVPRHESGALGLTSRRTVIVAILLGAAIGWLIVATMQRYGFTVPLVPWSLAILLVFGAIVLVVFTAVFRRKLLEHRDEISPTGAVAALAAAKVCLLSGAVLAGGYSSYALLFIAHLDIPMSAARVYRAGTTVVAAAMFAAAGALLERACVSPVDPNSEGNTDPA